MDMELLVAIIVLNIDCAVFIMYAANHAFVEILSCSQTNMGKNLIQIELGETLTLFQ